MVTNLIMTDPTGQSLWVAEITCTSFCTRTGAKSKLYYVFTVHWYGCTGRGREIPRKGRVDFPCSLLAREREGALTGRHHPEGFQDEKVGKVRCLWSFAISLSD